MSRLLRTIRLGIKNIIIRSVKPPDREGRDSKFPQKSTGRNAYVTFFDPYNPIEALRHD